MHRICGLRCPGGERGAEEADRALRGGVRESNLQVGVQRGVVFCGRGDEGDRADLVERCRAGRQGCDFVRFGAGGRWGGEDFYGDDVGGGGAEAVGEYVHAVGRQEEGLGVAELGGVGGKGEPGEEVTARWERGLVGLDGDGRVPCNIGRLEFCKSGP